MGRLFSDPDRIQTCDLQLRRLPLYSAELPDLIIRLYCKNCKNLFSYSTCDLPDKSGRSIQLSYRT